MNKDKQICSAYKINRTGLTSFIIELN